MDGSTEYIWWIKVTIAASNKVSAIWSILKMVTGNGYHPKKRTTCHCYNMFMCLFHLKSTIIVKLTYVVIEFGHAL